MSEKLSFSQKTYNYLSRNDFKYKYILQQNYLKKYITF